MIGPGSRLRPWVRGVVLVAAPIVVVALVRRGDVHAPVRAADAPGSGATVVTKADVARARQDSSSSTNVYHLDTARIEAALAADPWIGGAEVERRSAGRRWRSGHRTGPRGPDPAGRGAGGGGGRRRAPARRRRPTGCRRSRAAMSDRRRRPRGCRDGRGRDRCRRCGERVRALIIDVGDELRIELTGGLRVEFGTGGDASAKAGALRSVLRWAVRDRVTLRTVDVSVPGAPSAILADGNTFTG